MSCFSPLTWTDYTASANNIFLDTVFLKNRKLKHERYTHIIFADCLPQTKMRAQP